MKYTKMHGAGNDFVIINNIIEKIPVEKFTKIAKTLCQRRLSIGADGLMVVDKPEKDGDYRMIFYNSDGSIGEMCGNGARCIARYGYENKLAGETQKVETTAGLVIGYRESERQYKIRLNDLSIVKHDITLELPEEMRELFGEVICSYVELGNPGLPHAVVPMPNLDKVNKEMLWKLGAYIRSYKDFPKGANVNFYDVIGEDKVNELTFERGVEDFTYACGTGTGSTIAVLTMKKLVSGENVEVTVPGGTLYISIGDKETYTKDVYLTGPTNIVAIGEVTDEDLVF